MKPEDNGQSEEKARTLAGAPKMGWFCGYTPLEIIYAAGFMPFRVTGHTNPASKADALMHPNMCPFVRSTLDAALAGAYKQLEGAVFVNSCDAMRRLHDVWKKYAGHDFTFIIDLPRTREDTDVEYLRDEFAKLRRALEEHFEIKISDGTIKAAAKVINESREIFKQLSDLRLESPPRISGTEIAQMSSLFFTIPRDMWNRTAEAMLQQKKESQPQASGRPRVILAGSPIHSPEIISFIESCGLDVVYDDLCSCGRFFDMSVGNTVDALTDLSKAYLNKPSCARMMMLDERAERIDALARKFKADGIIHHSLKFCDTYLYDAPEVKKALTAAGHKTLFVEGDCTLGSFGQLKTRIEAFAEILNNK